ncbi:uncharacterized protein TNCV_2692741 [Trichonephila clavipes]|uniref:Uncharacterized protein n=1 Tax=Trichonephila clavipes TaxID=2585209 RepID=A0A8X7BAS5_TRICX|nr:uncharacterized protein TNCV_2692741 [Trichonephila clavipes]
MEKFGYLVCDSCSPGEFLYIHPTLFLNIIDCVQNVVLRKDISDKRIVYFKIFNNSEIVQYIHNDAQEECFGFCQLHRTDPNDKFKVFSPNKHLFVNLLDCVLEARDITSDEVSEGLVIPKTSSSYRFFKGIFHMCIDNVVVNLSFPQKPVQPNLLSTAVKSECKVTTFPVNSLPITSAPIKRSTSAPSQEESAKCVSSSPLAPLKFFER